MVMEVQLDVLTVWDLAVCMLHHLLDDLCFLRCLVVDGIAVLAVPKNGDVSELLAVQSIRP